MLQRLVRVAVVGYGNVGRAAVEAVQAARDLELMGVVEQPAVLASAGGVGGVDPKVPFVADLDDLPGTEVALLAVPSRSVPQVALSYLQRGIHTVDCFDMHGEPLTRLRKQLTAAAMAAGKVAMTAAGWDPGVDSLVRGLMLAVAPRGLTYTNHGPGVSLGHTVAAKAIPGVREAMSVTTPLGAGFHRRVVYVTLEPGARLEAVRELIRGDSYFSHDELQVIEVADVRGIVDVGHSVLIERKGATGQTDNQVFKFEAHVNNPALTGQVMAVAARAAARQPPGCYSLLEVPISHLLAGDLAEVLETVV